MRVDKWLWTARLYKTRGLAADAVKGHRVHVNGAVVKPSREVGPGDELELTLGPVRRTVIVRGAAARRVSAAEAAQLYEETEASVAERARQAELGGSTAQSSEADALPSATVVVSMSAGGSDHGPTRRPVVAPMAKRVGRW